MKSFKNGAFHSRGPLPAIKKPTQMTIEKLFDMLDDWRNLPAYQLERRADIFFAIHLEKIINEKTGCKIDLIIPEFPVRVGEISEKHPDLNKSFKIDYLTFSKSDNKVYLIELKTDLRSRRDKQDWYLESAVRIGIKGLLEGLEKIYIATNQKIKYNYLMDKIESVGWIERNENGLSVNDVLIEPEILYIQPLNENNESNVISFDDIIEFLSNNDDPLTKRFRKSLEIWKKDTNKK